VIFGNIFFNQRIVRYSFRA